MIVITRTEARYLVVFAGFALLVYAEPLLTLGTLAIVATIISLGGSR